MTRWFTSDLHLGDPWAAKMRYCGDDVAKHDAWLAQRWDATVAPGDVVWVLGDVANGAPLAAVTDWVQARPGAKVLVRGNLDGWSADELHAVGFDLVFTSVSLHLLDGSKVFLTHRPQPNLRLPVAAVLHGHTHKHSKWSQPTGASGHVHVGWEAWRRYVPEQDIVDLIQKESTP